MWSRIKSGLRAFVAGVLTVVVAAVVVNAASIPIFVGPGQSGGTIAIRPDLIPDLNALINQINSLVTPQSMATYQNFRNVLDNGEFIVVQRSGSSSTAPTGITNTATYWQDRWAAFGGSSSSVSLSQTTSGSSPTLPPMFQNGAQLQRASSNSNTGQICLVQEIPAKDVAQLAGQPVVLSYYAAAGANYSSASSGLIVGIVSGTNSDQGLAGLIANTWTGQANVVSGSQTITTSYTRYSTTGIVPTAAQELAVEFCYQPVGTAGTNDFVGVTGVQLEQGSVASQYEHRPLMAELEKDYAYFYQLNEPAVAANVAVGQVTSSNFEIITVPLPVPMRTTPSVTATVGTFKIMVAGAATTPNGFTASAVQSSTGTAIGISSSTTATSGQAVTLQGAGGTGKIVATADF